MKHTLGSDPAFPHGGVITSRGDVWDPGDDGMTLLQWYAGLAMQGILAGRMVMAATPPLKPGEVAEAAFNYAEALLAEAARRNHPQGG